MRTLTSLDWTAALAGVNGAMLITNAVKLYWAYFGDDAPADWQGESGAVMLVGAALSFVVMGVLMAMARKQRLQVSGVA